MTSEATLAHALLTQQPRERSGGPTSNRFAYQRTWALCHLLRLHRQSGDYVLVMEFHDDVLVLNSSTAPTSADFFQLKTLTDKMWKLRPLLAVDKAKGTTPVSKKKGTRTRSATTEDGRVPRSILGKLLDHAGRFDPQHVRTLNIVSNAKFALDVASPPPCHQRETTCMAELSNDALVEIRSKLKAELGLKDEPSLHNVYLITSGISLTDHVTHGLGAFAEFLEQRKPGGRFAVQPLYRAVCDEIARRATHEWQATTFAEVCKRKGIDRQQFESILRAAEGQFDPLAEYDDVKAQLARENRSYRDLVSVGTAWRRYHVERMDESNVSVQALRNELLPILNSVLGSGGWSALSDLVATVRDRYTAASSQPLFEASYLEGAILFELKLIEKGAIQTPTAQSPAGVP